jgi:hypothetical protein
MRKESDLRRATEERALLRELNTINQLTLRKLQREPTGEEPLLISEESLAQVISLENRIKLEHKKTQELQSHGELVAKQLDDVENAISEKNNTIAIIKETTAWDRHGYASRGFANEENTFREHQLIVTQLEEKQKTLKDVSEKLDQKIQRLTAELETKKNIEEEIQEATKMLLGKQTELTDLTDRRKQLERIMAKKEKLLAGYDREDRYKSVRLLEGDKKVLHHELARTSEAVAVNTKSILAQELRLRQLEMRLQAINAFLQDLFADMERSEELPESVDPGASEVPLEEFDRLQQELAVSRHTVSWRDAELEERDAKVEQLEKKINILHCAIVTRTASAGREQTEMEREHQILEDHLNYMRSEFELEFEKLSAENAALEAKLKAQ